MKPEEEANQILKDLRSLGQIVEALERKVETPRPKFTHDCRSVLLLFGDSYRYCPVRQRWPEYQSGMGSSLPWLKKAEALAVEQGLSPWPVRK